MASYLLCDFGATNVKTAALDSDTGTFTDMRRHDGLGSVSALPGRYEISLASLRLQFLGILSLYYNQLGVKFDGVFISSQMHGFALVDDSFAPLTDYISWRDERASSPAGGMEAMFPLLEKNHGLEFRSITGMRIRPGFPFVNLCHLAREGSLPGGRVITIPDWLANISGKSTRFSHETMLAGLGLYDIGRHCASETLLSVCRSFGGKYVLNSSAGPGESAGYWEQDGRLIPIYCGVGDHQCAVLGAGNREGDTLSLNLGTGSQVSRIGAEPGMASVEARPFFDGKPLRTITHIPCGRALQEFVGFANALRSPGGAGAPSFWDDIASLKPEDVVSSSLDLNLSIFKSAWNYSGGGAIGGIDEKNFTPANYAASLVRCFIRQYMNAAAEVDPRGGAKDWVLSGGVARKMKVLPEALAIMSGKRVVPAAGLDETFLGLRALAVMTANKIGSAEKASSVFGTRVLQ